MSEHERWERYSHRAKGFSGPWLKPLVTIEARLCKGIFFVLLCISFDLLLPVFWKRDTPLSSVWGLLKRNGETAIILPWKISFKWSPVESLVLLSAPSSGADHFRGPAVHLRGSTCNRTTGGILQKLKFPEHGLFYSLSGYTYNPFHRSLLMILGSIFFSYLCSQDNLTKVKLPKMSMLFPHFLLISWPFCSHLLTFGDTPLWLITHTLILYS